MLMFGRDIRTKIPNVEKGDDISHNRKKTNDIRHHHQEYRTKMKQYADQKRRAKEHNFEVGDVVYIASMENGKLDSIFRDTLYVLLKNTSDNSFELINTEDGSKVIRNVKHLRHTPVVMDFDVPEPTEARVLNDNLDMEFAQITPAVEIPPEPDSAPVPEWQVVTTRRGRVVRKPARYRDT